MRWRALLVLLLALLPCRRALAAVERFAVIVGNDSGRSGEERLRYAQADAEKVAQVLGDVGGFAPANVVLLRGSDASTVRSTLIAVNDRVRSATSLPDTQVLLFVYYSGHADASALHLGGSELALSELALLVRGSAATFRILVLDACRSGALTRLKGGRVAPAFDIGREPTLEGEGMAFLTASAVDEDAQESDELKGSFFTHAFVSGLLGAADVDGDGDVVLEEAYRHAYDATLRSTSQTFAGTQHPMFQYDVRGQGAVVLSRLHRSSHGVLHVPEGMSFLIMHDSRDGAVVAEVGSRGSARSLALRPGRYFVRGRGPDELVEGDVSLVAGESRNVDTSQYQRVQYAQLVRKGGRASGLAQGPELGASARTRLPNADAPCVGPMLGYRVEWPGLSVYARLTGCRGGFENDVLEATTSDVQAALYAVKAWDLRWLTLGAGLGAGVDIMHQSFESRGQAPDQLALAPLLGILVNVSRPLGAGFFAELDLSGEAHWLRLHGVSVDSSLTAAVSARLALLVGFLY